ncbi:MAG: M14 family metallocarboxypeptidase [Clostridia bacterium]|nr:M14 family metallocarboxypeptidase [Clostridia bacterium]
MSDKATEHDRTTDFCPFDTGKAILDYPVPMDHARMMQYLECFRERYSFLDIQNLGSSVLGKNIPLISLGQGKKCVLYVGAHHGMEWITTILLLRFINEYAESYRTGRHIYSVYLPYLFRQRRILIVPMLNPDGVDYVINGVAQSNPLRERLIKMNGGSTDFSQWQANGRGVDLNHNYNADFEEYRAYAAQSGISEGAPSRYCGENAESEPETGYLCNYLRYAQNDIGAILSFHTQGEEIYYSSRGITTPRSLPLARILSRLTSYKLTTPEGHAAYSGLLDWCVQKMNIPAFTLECGKGTNPLPQELYFCIYAAIRELLFETPQLI